MSNGSSGNASSTGTTPGNEAPNTHNLTEAAYLKQRADEAQQALSRTMQLLGENLKQGINPAAWTEQHPWIMVSSAAVAGFAVTLLIPSKEQRHEKRLLKRLAAIERAVAPRPASGEDGKNPSKHGVFRGLLNEAIKAVRPAIMSAITAGISAKAASDNDQPPAQPEPGYAVADTGDSSVAPPT